MSQLNPSEEEEPRDADALSRCCSPRLGLPGARHRQPWPSRRPAQRGSCAHVGTAQPPRGSGPQSGVRRVCSLRGAPPRAGTRADVTPRHAPAPGDSDGPQSPLPQTRVVKGVFAFFTQRTGKTGTHGETCSGSTIALLPAVSLPPSLTGTEPKSARGLPSDGNEARTPDPQVPHARSRRHPTRVAAPGVRDCRRDVPPKHRNRNSPPARQSPTRGSVAEAGGDRETRKPARCGSGPAALGIVTRSASPGHTP